MRRLTDLFEILLYYIVGFLIFSIIVSMVEYIFVLCLSDSTESLLELFNINLKKCIKVYTIIFVFMYLLNLIYGFISVKLLNEKLKQIKWGGLYE